MVPMFVPMFLPVIAAAIARGAAVVGRLAVGAGRAIASVGGKVGQAAGRAVQRGGVAMARYGQQGARGAGNGVRGAVQPGRAAGRGRRPVTPRSQNGGRRRGRQRQSVSMGQAWRQAVRRGARQAAQRSRGNGPPSFIQNMFGQNSYFGRIAQNFGSAKMNFKQGNNLAGAVDSAKVAGDVSKPFIATAIAIATFPKIIKEWGASLIESKRQLGEFNAAYSVATMRLDVNRFQRNLRLSNATSGSFSRMTQMQNKLEDRLAPYAIAGANALLKIATLALNVADKVVQITEIAVVVSGWSPVLKAIGRWLNANEQQPQNQPLADLAQALGRGNFQRRQRPPMPDPARPAQQ